MRVYVPATLAVLAELAARGELPASADRFVAADETEEAEYDALSEAAAVSAALLGGVGRRVVVVAELTDPDGPVPVNLVDAVHADADDVDPAAGELPDLGWYAVQEIPDLLGRGDAGRLRVRRSGYVVGMSLHPDEPNQGPLTEPDEDPIPPGEDPADDPSPEPDLA